MKTIEPVVLFSLAMIIARGAANPCEEQQRDPEILDTYSYTDHSNTKHCFFRLSDTVANTTWTYFEEDRGGGEMHPSRRVNKKKCQDACWKHKATLPILPEKGIHDFIQNVTKVKLINGRIPLGFTIKHVSDDFQDVDVEWDTGIETRIKSQSIYGSGITWILVDEYHITMLASHGASWESGELVSLTWNFYLVCHYNPDFTKAATSSTSTAVHPESASFAPATSSVQSFQTLPVVFESTTLFESSTTPAINGKTTETANSATSSVFSKTQNVANYFNSAKSLAVVISLIMFLTSA